MRNVFSRVKLYIVEFSDFVQSVFFIGSLFNTVMVPIIDKCNTIREMGVIQAYSRVFSVHSISYYINLLILIFFLTKLIVNMFLDRKKSMTDEIHLFEKLHDGYIHDMRNHIHDLQNLEKDLKIMNMDDKDDRKTYESLYNSQYRILQKVTQQCVDQISRLINENMGLPESGGDSICTCIKMVSIYEKEKSILDRSLITIARSSNSESKRILSGKKSVIGKNTDFLNLTKGYGKYFSGIELKKKYASGEYCNSTTDFSYESTVVVPIRFSDINSNVTTVSKKKKKSKIEIKVKSDVDIIGFLCIDTEKVLKEWERIDQVEKIVKILAFYADSLYVYLSSFQKTFTVNM